MAVTVADKSAPGKQRRFVGICIYREGQGLSANFILRNVIDGQGLCILTHFISSFGSILVLFYSPVVEIKCTVFKIRNESNDCYCYLSFVSFFFF